MAINTFMGELGSAGQQVSQSTLSNIIDSNGIGPER